MVAQTYDVPREKQDEYALVSHNRAEKVAVSLFFRIIILLELTALRRLPHLVSLLKRFFPLSYAVRCYLSTTQSETGSPWSLSPS